MKNTPTSNGQLAASIKTAKPYTAVNRILPRKLVSLEQRIATLEAKVESSGHYTIKTWAFVLMETVIKIVVNLLR